ncbi:secretion protein [Sphingobacteriaceae bacterium]|nr:secretion protein [Sphingobacteriaceae bacterium]
MKAETLHKDSEACERCTQKFECRPDDIAACDCAKISLSKEEYSYISSHFTMCLCNSCLKELKEEYNKESLKSTSSIITLLIGFLSVFCMLHLNGQVYAPSVGQAGTSAIHMDSSAFVNWAVACSVTRGYQDISNTSLGYANVGDNTMATGKAQSNGVVSLGDGGTAICTFNKRITNGPGYDFAIFENGFDDVFLELAFVEVSSDGNNFFRFPAHSLTDTSLQTGSFGSTDAKKINNLAGKYRGGYGSPFDLEELSGIAGLNINAITHVKVIDVVGSINVAYASRDAQHNKVNDPWPTPFPSSGFDLDAIGVIHQSTVTSLKEQSSSGSYLVYPNPVQAGEELTIGINDSVALELLDISGKIVAISNTSTLQTSHLIPGIYCLRVSAENKQFIQKIIVRP